MPARLLALECAHFGIENRVHYVRGVPWGEDQARIRLGAALQGLTALRSTALTLIRCRGFTPAEAFDHFFAYRHRAIKAVHQGRTE